MTRKLHFLKYKELFKNGFILLFEFGKLLPERCLGVLFPQIKGSCVTRKFFFLKNKKSSF